MGIPGKEKGRFSNKNGQFSFVKRGTVSTSYTPPDKISSHARGSWVYINQISGEANDAMKELRLLFQIILNFEIKICTC